MDAGHMPALTCPPCHTLTMRYNTIKHNPLQRNCNTLQHFRIQRTASHQNTTTFWSQSVLVEHFLSQIIESFCQGEQASCNTSVTPNYKFYSASSVVVSSYKCYAT